MMCAASLSHLQPQLVGCCNLLQGTKINSRGQEVPQHVRLYSIASSRYGDSGDGKTCTLCVVRVIYPGVLGVARGRPGGHGHVRA